MMNRVVRSLLAPFFFTAILIVSSCSTVPKEVVELSYTVGRDLEEVHASYRALVQKHFETLRAQTLNYLNNRWIPNYLDDFIKNGELITFAQEPDSVKAFEGVSAWVETAIEDIENKKKELLSPIDQDEKELLRMIDDAFASLTRANAVITAHLNSLRQVQEVQDEALKALKMKDLRDQINDQLSLASEKAEIAIEKLKKAQRAVEKVDGKGLIKR